MEFRFSPFLDWFGLVCSGLEYWRQLVVGKLNMIDDSVHRPRQQRLWRSLRVVPGANDSNDTDDKKINQKK